MRKQRPAAGTRASMRTDAVMVLLLLSCSSCGSGLVEGDGWLEYNSMPRGQFSSRFPSGNTTSLRIAVGAQPNVQAVANVEVDFGWGDRRDFPKSIGVLSADSDDPDILEVVSFRDVEPDSKVPGLILRALKPGKVNLDVKTNGHGWIDVDVPVAEPAKMEWTPGSNYNRSCFEGGSLVFAGQEVLKSVVLRDRDRRPLLADGYSTMFRGEALRVLSVSLQSTKTPEHHTARIKVTDKPGLYDLRPTLPGVSGEIKVVGVEDIDEMVVENRREGEVNPYLSSTFRIPKFYVEGERFCLEHLFVDGDYDVKLFTPDVCQPVFSTGVEDEAHRGDLSKAGWFVSSPGSALETGAECHYRISLPQANHGEGLVFEEKYQITPLFPHKEN